MISLRCPDSDQIARLLLSLDTADYTYPQVGATRGEMPDGYNIDRHSAIIGHGNADFENAKQAIRDWKPFELPWIKTFPQSAPKTGTMIAVIAHLFGMWWTNVSRVLYTIDEAERFGFAYGTLPHHAESGEELFLVDRSGETNEVHYRITAFSRPRHPLARLGYPFSRGAQERFGNGSIDAMKRAVSDPARY
ncbi:MAG: DUF1990 domain-containing protein [Myxococcales bacterium]|nr:DUF1990 domain-containing protein [Myxococcales bacterium]HIK84200.1 DUF1990 domain-containing protein [Myxococcales bacterium]